MGKEITFDKFIRWAGVTLIVLAVLFMTNYLSSVLLGEKDEYEPLCRECYQKAILNEKL